MEANQFFEPPRWPGGPKICIYENLPAFKTAADLKLFNVKNGDKSIIESWRCPICQHVHAIIKGMSPAGDSSGNSREFFYGKPRYQRENRKALEI